MRPDKPKAQAQPKSDAKVQKKDLEDRNPPKTAAKAEHDDDNVLAHVRHREQQGPTIH